MSSLSKRLLNPKVAGTCGILGQSIVFVCILLAVAISPWFSWTDNALSDLGSLANPDSARIFNTGLVLGGLVTLVFVLGLGQKTKRNTLALIGTIFLLTSSMGTIGVGMFPEDYPLPHIVSALVSFMSLSCALLIFGFVQLHSKQTRMHGTVSLILGLVSVVTLFVPLGYFVAILEMTAIVCGCTWVLISSVRLITGKDIISGRQQKTR